MTMGAQLMGISPPLPPEPAVPETSMVVPVSGSAEILMIDTTHANVGNIPESTPKVAGYDTGTPDVDWTNTDWARFPHSGKVHIDQSPDLMRYGSGQASVADCEFRAGLVPAWVTQTKTRQVRGEDGWIYGSRTTIEQAGNELAAAGGKPEQGGCWLADWNLSQAEATALLGTHIAGLLVVAVQWASPSSNPSTIVPGSTLTLAEANVDLSVTQAAWFAAVTPPRPTQAEAHAAISAVEAAFHSMSVAFDILVKYVG